MSRVAPNPPSPFADADPELRHLFPVPILISTPPLRGSLAPTGCGRLAVVPHDVTDAPLLGQLPDGVCSGCIQAMREDEPLRDDRPVAACHRCLAPTRHDGLCALCRVDMHEHWQAEHLTPAAQATTRNALDYRQIRHEQRPKASER